MNGHEVPPLATLTRAQSARMKMESARDAGQRFNEQVAAAAAAEQARQNTVTATASIMIAAKEVELPTKSLPSSPTGSKDERIAQLEKELAMVRAELAETKDLLRLSDSERKTLRQQNCDTLIQNNELLKTVDALAKERKEAVELKEKLTDALEKAYQDRDRWKETASQERDKRK